MSPTRRAAVIKRMSFLALLLSVVFGISLALIETTEPAVRALSQAREWGDGEKGVRSNDQKSRTPHLTVFGLGISEDVAQATENDPDFYLAHDIDGNPSYMGAAFCDYRSTAASRHTVIYGHNLSGTGKMFSPLRTAWEQRTFQKIQGAELTTRTGSAVALKPLCAARIDASDQEIQRFDFQSTEDFTIWLREIVSRAEVETSKSNELTRRATSCVSLITCASVRPHQRERTLVIFVPDHRRASSTYGSQKR